LPIILQIIWLFLKNYIKGDKTIMIEEIMFKKKISTANIFKSLLTIAFLLTLAFIIAMKSPLNYWSNGVAATDSSVFKYVALVMSKGGMPYKDTFDHKGPLIYIINYIGQLISYYRGIWILEFISIFIFIFIAYKIAYLFCSQAFSCFIVAVITAPLASYFEGGNLVEEYAMPFIAVALYFFIDYFLNSKINRFRLIFSGISFGAVVMLRPNMISVWIVFCIAVLIQNIKHKKKIPYDFFLWFLIGIAIIIVPILFWLVKGGAFSDFINDYLIFNIKYSSAEDRANAYNKYNAIMKFLNCSILLISIVSLIYLVKKKANEFFNLSYLIYILITIFLMTMSGMGYLHYGMILIPLLVYPLSQMANIINLEYKGDSIIAIYSMVLLLFVFADWKTNLNSVANALHSPQKTVSISEDMKRIFEIISDNTSDNEKIMVIGNMDFYYIYSNRLAASRYSYQIPIANIDNKIKEEFINDLINNKPKIVIVLDYTSNEYMDLFITKENYDLLDVADKKVGIYKIK